MACHIHPSLADKAVEAVALTQLMPGKAGAAALLVSSAAAAVVEGAALAGPDVLWTLPMTAVEVAQHASPTRALPNGAHPVQRLLDLAFAAAAAAEPLLLPPATVAACCWLCMAHTTCCQVRWWPEDSRPVGCILWQQVNNVCWLPLTYNWILGWLHVICSCSLAGRA